MEGLDPESVMAFAGSSEPLHYTVLAFTSPSKPLVTADPGYEAPMWAAKIAGAEVIKVPLADPKGAASHDIKAMLAASAMPGVIYICNPNNPTGTVTPRADIEYVVANAPKGTIVLIDEAYIHLCDAPRSLHLSRKARTSSSCAPSPSSTAWPASAWASPSDAPTCSSRLRIGGQNSLPITAMAAAKASLLDPGPGAQPQEADRRHPRGEPGLAQERRAMPSRLRRATASCWTCAVPARKCWPPWRRRTSTSAASGRHGPPGAHHRRHPRRDGAFQKAFISRK
jgi:hypothetical protein